MTDESPLPHGPGFGLTFLYYFSGTALVATLLASKSLGLSLDTGIPTQFGVLLGVIGGILGALVNRSTTLEVPLSSKKKFKQQLDTLLAEMGYTEDETSRTDGILVYRRSSLRQLLSGRVYVQLGPKQAAINSRVTHIRRIKKQLAP
jgi:hypothetical protein